MKKAILLYLLSINLLSFCKNESLNKPKIIDDSANIEIYTISLNDISDIDSDNYNHRLGLPSEKNENNYNF